MSTPYSPLTTHVLDTAQGRPAKKMQISLHRKDESSESWHLVKQGETNDDGRLAGLVTKELFSAGTYKMRFETGSYFSALNTETFYPYVEVVFEIKKTNEHYHVPLLISPYGFSTYRGS